MLKKENLDYNIFLGKIRRMLSFEKHTSCICNNKLNVKSFLGEDFTKKADNYGHLEKTWECKMEIEHMHYFFILFLECFSGSNDTISL